MNIKALQRRLSAFHVLRKPVDGDGDDLGGEVIDAANPDAGDTPGADEDRGDNFTPTSEEAPAPAAPAPATDDEPDEATGGKPSNAIPKGRFNEVNEARKEAEARAEALQRELDALKMQPAAAPAPTTAAPAAPAAPEFDVDAAEQKYIELLMEGETGEATKLRSQINRHVAAEAAQQAMSMQREAAARVDLQTVADKAVETWPYLNTPEGADALDLIKASRDANIARGMAPAKALQLAVDKIAPKFAPEEGAPPTLGLPANKAAVDTRTANAIARGAKAADAQAPAVQAGIGNRATAGKVDYASLTDEQFDALSEAEKAKARGDIF
ncbi:MAG TPA: hypothetical protein PK797_07460 [Burkholderiaceae bacterium]|nr:hypothetical protein [Burkholderiaceae bacterium]